MTKSGSSDMGSDEGDTPPEKIRQLLGDAKSEAVELGGWEAFKNGEWLLRLIEKSFRAYWQHANADYFRSKYPGKEDDFIAKKLIGLAAGNAALLGTVTGTAISADEIIGVAQTVGSGGAGALGLPANVAIAFTAISSEVVLLTRLQLQLVANLGKLYDIPLDPDDPEDIITILSFAIGGSISEASSKVGVRMSGGFAKTATRKHISKGTLKAIQKIGAKLGVKILQRTIIKYVVPLVSVGVGAGWNYLATRSVGYIAKKHFLKRRTELNMT